MKRTAAKAAVPATIRLAADSGSITTTSSSQTVPESAEKESSITVTYTNEKVSFSVELTPAYEAELLRRASRPASLESKSSMSMLSTIQVAESVPDVIISVLRFPAVPYSATR